MRVQVFQEPKSGKWFYSVTSNFSVYRGNRGYDTKEQATEAAWEHAKAIKIGG
jgi:hypothetical protein